MPNSGHYTVCPYYKDSREKTIICEDITRTFRWKMQRHNYMLKYCDSEWKLCPYAKKISEMYDRIEKGANMSEEKYIENMQELNRELKHVRKLLKRAEEREKEKEQTIERIKKHKDAIEEHYKILHRKYEEEKRNAAKVAAQIGVTISTYEARFCYLISKYANGEFDENEFREWSKDKEFALISSEKDEKGVTTKFKAIVRESKSNGNKLKS